MAKADVGDTVNITRKGLVVTDSTDTRIWVKDDGGTVRSYYYKDVDLSVAKKAVKNPDYWPPQSDDVWKSDIYAVIYHIVGSKAYRTTYSGGISTQVDPSTLKDYPDLRLVWRNL